MANSAQLKILELASKNQMLAYLRVAILRMDILRMGILRMGIRGMLHSPNAWQNA